MRSTVRVEGLAEVQRELRAMERSLPSKVLTPAGRRGADVVAQEARRRVPHLTGRLAGSIRPQAQQRKAFVKAGTPARVPYAAVIEFGSPRRNIRPQPYLFPARDAKQEEVIETYLSELKSLSRLHFPTASRFRI